jgi:hypothetical protein
MVLHISAVENKIKAAEKKLTELQDCLIVELNGETIQNLPAGKL